MGKSDVVCGQRFLIVGPNFPFNFALRPGKRVIWEAESPMNGLLFFVAPGRERIHLIFAWPTTDVRPLLESIFFFCSCSRGADVSVTPRYPAATMPLCPVRAYVRVVASRLRSELEKEMKPIFCTLFLPSTVCIETIITIPPLVLLGYYFCTKVTQLKQGPHTMGPKSVHDAFLILNCRAASWHLTSSCTSGLATDNLLGL